MNIKLVHEKAIIPTKGSDQSAGYDLYTIDNALIQPRKSAKLRTGICLEMENNTVGLIWERSKLASKFGIQILGGVVDCDYRGEVMISVYNAGEKPFEVYAGDRMAQIIFQQYYNYDFNVVSELNDTSRGTDGINSMETRR